jgi:predicted DsbA family dithiol-disulfide isomerase
MKTKLILFLGIILATNTIVFFITQRHYAMEKVDIFFPDEVTIDTCGFPVTPGNDSSLLLILYSDFECKYHSRMSRVLDTVLQHFDTQVRICFKPRPLSRNPAFWLQSKASLAAHNQKKFWNMSEALAGIKMTTNRESHQTVIRQRLLKCADSIGLDPVRFKIHLESNKIHRKLEKVIAETKKYGITGIPTLVINGKCFRGVSGAQNLISYIDNLFLR